MPSPEQIKAAAISDATFDGWDDFEKLARWQRERYLDRSKCALEASEAAAPALLATALKQQEENAQLRDAVRQAQGVLATLSNPRPGESTMHVYAAAVAAEAKSRAALSPKTGASG